MPNTLLDLKNQVKRYFDANTSLYTVVQGQPADVVALTAQIELALMISANNARRFAEMRHDFAVNDVVGTATITAGAPVSLDAVALSGPHLGQTASFKSVRAVHLVDPTSNQLTPIAVTTRQAETIAIRKRIQLESDRHEFETRYPAEESASPSRSLAIINGRYLTVQPFSDTTSTPIAIDGNRWSSDYTADGDTDFFLDKGFEFMQWQCICEINHMLLKFVPRQEGALAPPTQPRDIALENLILLDSYSVQGNIWHDL